ncbi:hypothetical protein CRM22_009894 [Opisthorchis felineus]|uniref:RCC1-like domain-containing protein n=1 Tax=Opisthorchis felineus TaxID=147828 RepID=A0A4S2LAZ2_OPIFE|nr:hypothetical protein CRM22_009894 [Opisthorchis felineus]
MTSRLGGDGKVAVPIRGKRHSLHLDGSGKKRRKVDTVSGSRSPLVHTSTVQMKQPLLPPVSFSVPGLALLFGVGDTGQLGLGPDITERSRPCRFSKASLTALGIGEQDLESLTTQICAGGMHTVCLTGAGRVITCGCNDEGALGRNVLSDSELQPPTKKPHIDGKESGHQDSDVPDLLAEETYPAYVPLPPSVKICMVSAGDSHTAALDSEGQVWLWGTFRGASGPIGLTEAGEISQTPKRLFPPISTAPATDRAPGGEGKPVPSSAASSLHMGMGARVVKIASGQDHLVCLTDEGRLYTMGCGEQGQLGRIAERFARTGGRHGMSALLSPAECRVRGAVRFSDAWAGGFATFARCQATGTIYACGLNNYGQLGLKKPSAVVNGDADENDEATIDGGLGEEGDEMDVDAARLITDQNEVDKSEAVLLARQGPLIQFMLTKAHGFSRDRNWRQFAVGMHHTLALDGLGHVYAVGRPDYGRLGLGKPTTVSHLSVPQPSRVQGLLSDRTCSWVGCGEACSFAVDTSGVAYSWGMGSNKQLGHGDDDDEDCYEPGVIKGKQLENRFVSVIDAGGQHTVLLAHSSLPSNGMPLANAPPLSNDITSGNGHDLPDEASYTSSALKTPSSENIGNNISVFSTTIPHPASDNKFADLSAIAPVLAPAHPRRNRHLSPSSVTGYAPVTFLGRGADSTTCSTAGATINSSVHSSAVSDTSSVGSCASNTSTSSQLNSAKSTDGGGSSRCSSFGTYSVQSSLPVGPPAEDVPGVSANNGSLMLDPLSASLLATSRTLTQTARAGAVGCRSTQIRSAGMSICSTSSEAGLPTDTISLGSMTASPADLISGEQSSS